MESCHHSTQNLGGESAALERLDYYLWKSDCVAKYKETRNGLIGENYSTKVTIRWRRTIILLSPLYVLVQSLVGGWLLVS